MKKNGFTLIELLATLTLLGIIATILITVSVKKIEEAKNESRNTMIQSIELAAKNYALNYGDENSTFKNNDYMYVTLNILAEKELFSNSLIDQTTKMAVPLTDYVYVTRDRFGVDAKYDINQKTNAKITLNGSYNTYVKKGVEYVEAGATAIKNGSSVSVTTTGTVDVNLEGTYVITYTVDDVSITRNVIVY